MGCSTSKEGGVKEPSRGAPNGRRNSGAAGDGGLSPATDADMKASGASKAPPAGAKPVTKPGVLSTMDTGPLSRKDYNSRIATSNGAQTVTVPGAGYTLKYAYVSQRGYYPEALDKANQDALCVHKAFGGSPDDHFFGVFDGHGEHGTACAQFARDKLPENVLKDKDFRTDVQTAMKRQFIDTNNQLHRHNIDDSMSGTTAITILVRGRMLYVSNVGDSRATIAEITDKRVIARDLSEDQTPFRGDECERVKKAGARVLTLDQLEGLKDPAIKCWGTEEDDDGDPPRLWAPNGMYPGTAFTRSIGDHAAEKIGVFAEPEIMTYELSNRSPIIVVASDGVFEFLTSQMVIDLIQKFDDPQEAATAVVAESYRLWLQYETRTDDITIIIIQVQGIKDAPAPLAAANLPSRRGLRMDPAAATGTAAPSARPVRRHLSKEARKAIERSKDDADEDDDYRPPANLPKKTPEEVARLEAAVKVNFLFLHLNPSQRRQLFDLMEKRSVVPGQTIINQGDKGDAFYVIEKGVFETFIDDTLVHTYTTAGGTNPSFGELALMYRKPRAATVKTKTAGSLWALDRRAFKSVASKKSDSASVVRVLRGMEVLAALRFWQLQRLADVLREEIYEDGATIIRQGEPADKVYIIEKGQVVATVRKKPADTAEPPREILRMSSSQSFGESALQSDGPRAANVVAVGRVHCLTVSRDTFEEVLGPLAEVAEADRKWRERVAAYREALAKMAGRPTPVQVLGLSLGHMKPTETLYSTDTTSVSAVAYETPAAVPGAAKDVYVLKQTAVSLVEKKGIQSQVMREHGIMKALSPCPQVPSFLKSFKDKKYLSVVLACKPFSTLEALLSSPVTEKTAMHYVASVIVALEHLHMENIVFRGLSPATVLIDTDGRLQLADFRFAKHLQDGRTYTLCGAMEYMAPEMVQHLGHNGAADFWALGVLTYSLLTGETPYAKVNDNELKIFGNITNNKVVYPSGFSSTLKDLLSKLLNSDASMRLGCGPGGLRALKNHAWFADIDWEALAMGAASVKVPDEILQRMKQLDPYGIEPLNADAFTGDMAWAADF